jgi:hypothetical protein
MRRDEEDRKNTFNSVVMFILVIGMIAIAWIIL